MENEEKELSTPAEEAEAEQAVPEEPDETAKLTEEIAQLNDRLLRSAAEFDNFRKRTAREKAELYQDATVKCVAELLPVLDNFERALEAQTEESELRRGVEMILTQLKEAFAKLGVTEIEAQGKPFDPMLHNAVNQTEDPAYDKNTVCQVLQKGYRLNDKVIRHAMVVVANP